jgi:hypothetical protein
MNDGVDIDELADFMRLNPDAKSSEILEFLREEERIRRQKQTGTLTSFCEACAQTNGCLCNSRDEDDRWYWSR